MPLILAIDPDRRQAAQLTAVIRHRIGAELILVDTTERALVAIGNRVPDLVLVPALLSPQDDAALATALRVIAATAHVQMLTIPALAAQQPKARAGGVLSALCRGRSRSHAHEGCDPAVFAEQIRSYLERALHERAAASQQARSLNDVEAPALTLESMVEAHEQHAIVSFDPFGQLWVEGEHRRTVDGRVAIQEESVVAPRDQRVVANQQELVVASGDQPTSVIEEEPVAEPHDEPIVVIREEPVVAPPDEGAILVEKETLVASTGELVAQEEHGRADREIVPRPSELFLEAMPVAETGPEAAPRRDFNHAPEPAQEIEEFLIPFEKVSLPVIEEVREDPWVSVNEDRGSSDIDLTDALEEAVLASKAVTPTDGLRSAFRASLASTDEPFEIWPSSDEDDSWIDSREMMSNGNTVADVELWPGVLGSANQTWPSLEGMPADSAARARLDEAGTPAAVVEPPVAPAVLVAAPEPPALAVQSRSEGEWIELVESLRRDVERLRAERQSSASLSSPGGDGLAPRPIVTAAPVVVQRPKRRDRKPRPIQDEWGFFDPEQCGFAALLAKLDEVTQ